MVISMTGYGRSSKEIADSEVTVEMKAVNHRFCEINIRMPRQFFFLEDQLKKTISNYVQRGKVDVFIHLKGEGIVERSLSVDWDLFQDYHETYTKMIERTTSSAAFPVDQLLLHENVVEVQEKEEVTEDLKEMLLSAVEEASVQLKEMRMKEGQELYSDVTKRIEKLSGWTEKLTELAPTVQKNYRDRLQKRVEEFMNGALDIDEARMLTEVAVYADKTDIQEEITRIDSHLKQFIHILSEGGVVGRKLDFVVQELNRETNTIGSKANDIEISQLVVDLKSELEKVREQVQNIE
ncbi:YicC family protein [Bacillus shivajii]|uniref:YicC/YloC family endoribonuclease n=1 Tax=Bacillus shivajii TaxID=1983719 RepID=UPI001CFAED86|nr:YicC/YloC family endoribonuclease [Bacillus shivajii]UCZ51791.1 YicC family protein [Bacillus shivajii]